MDKKIVNTEIRQASLRKKKSPLQGIASFGPQRQVNKEKSSHAVPGGPLRTSSSSSPFILSRSPFHTFIS
jgi:hypothetical protein